MEKIMAEYTLMRPLFVNGNFNRENKKMRGVHVGDVSHEENGKTKTYRLFQKAGKPDRPQVTDQKGQYFLYLAVRCVFNDGDYLIPLSYTMHELIYAAGKDPAYAEVYGNKEDYAHFVNASTAEKIEEKRALYEAAIERYGSDPVRQAVIIGENCKVHRKAYQMALDAAVDGDHSHHPDFIGAALIDDLDCCCTIAKEYREWLDAERKKNQAEYERIREDAVTSAEKAFLYGGCIVNYLYWVYNEKGEGHQEYILTILLRKYGFKVTKGMDEKLYTISSLTTELDLKTAVKENRAPRMKSVSINRRDNASPSLFKKASDTFQEKWWELREKILAQT